MIVSLLGNTKLLIKDRGQGTVFSGAAKIEFQVKN